MKKFSILLMGAMALGLFSCQDESTNAIPQKNPQLPVMAADALKIEAQLPATMDLTALNTAETPIVVGEILEDTNFPEDYELKLVGEVGRQAEFTNVGTINLEIDGTSIFTNADAFEAAYVAAMGKGAKPKDIFFRILAYAVREDSEVTAEARIGGADVYYANATSTVTPYDLKIVIENGYGLVGTVNDWSIADAVMLNHSGLNVYDDAIFHHYFDLRTENSGTCAWWWKVVPQSTIDEGDWLDADDAQFGVAENGDHALSGDLLPMRITEDSRFEPQAGCVNEPGVYNFIADMENQYYTFEKVFDLLYVSGSFNLFDWSMAPRMFSADEGKHYAGFGLISGSLKLYGQPGFEGVVFGKGTGPTGLKLDGGNITIREEGFYMLVADIDGGKLNREIVTSLGIIGNHNSWGAQDNLTPSMDMLTWTGTVTLDGEFKIRVNDNWDYNLGGALDCLVYNGANMVAEAGTYDVTLDLTKLPYSLTLVKK